MSGHEPDSFAAHRLRSPRDNEATVLDRSSGIRQLRPVPDERHSTIQRQRLEAHGDHGEARSGRAHQCREDEERLCEGRGRIVARIVGVHEKVKVNLKFRVYAARRFERERARPNASNDRAIEARVLQVCHCVAGQSDGARYARPTLLRRVLVLGLPVISLDAAKAQPTTCGNPPRKRGDHGAWRRAAAIHPDIGLDERGQP
jgi:hypothetical protein